ncbi:MAG: NosD domain-containing protein [Candidatus Woesearchaeota archaeon]
MKDTRTLLIILVLVLVIFISGCEEAQFSPIQFDPGCYGAPITNDCTEMYEYMDWSPDECNAAHNCIWKVDQNPPFCTNTVFPCQNQPTEYICGLVGGCEWIDNCVSLEDGMVIDSNTCEDDYCLICPGDHELPNGITVSSIDEEYNLIETTTFALVSDGVVDDDCEFDEFSLNYPSGEDYFDFKCTKTGLTTSGKVWLRADGADGQLISDCVPAGIGGQVKCSFDGGPFGDCEKRVQLDVGDYYLKACKSGGYSGPNNYIQGKVKNRYRATSVADEIIVDCFNWATLRGHADGQGIKIEGDKVKIRNCEIIGYNDGIYVSNGELNSFSNNKIYGNRYGVRFEGSSNNYVYDNDLCHDGVKGNLLIDLYCDSNEPENSGSGNLLQDIFGCNGVSFNYCTSFPPVSDCGDGEWNPDLGEQCEFIEGNLDAPDFGGLTCSDYDDYTGGNLICNLPNSQDECKIDTSGCTPPLPPGECGDKVINGDDICDGNPGDIEGYDWGGIIGCTSYDDYVGGGLICNDECEFDVTECVPYYESDFCDSCNIEIGRFCCNDGAFTYCSPNHCEYTSCDFDGECKTKFYEDCNCPDCWESDLPCPDGYFCGLGGIGCVTAGGEPECGDGECNGGETCSTCPGDCMCPPDRSCGDNPLWQNGCPKYYNCCDKGNGEECYEGLCANPYCGSNSLVCEDGDSCGCSECEGEPDNCGLGLACVEGVCYDELINERRCGDGYFDPTLNEKCEFINGNPIFGGYIDCQSYDSYFESGDLICNPPNSEEKCTIDLSQCEPPYPTGPCENGEINDGEECDGNPWDSGSYDWDDKEGCTSFDNYEGGLLRCNNQCKFDVTQCKHVLDLCSFCSSQGKLCCGSGDNIYCGIEGDTGCPYRGCNDNTRCESGDSFEINEGCNCEACLYEKADCEEGYVCAEGGLGCMLVEPDIREEGCGDGILQWRAPFNEECDAGLNGNWEGCNRPDTPNECKFFGDSNGLRACGNNRLDDLANQNPPEFDDVDFYNDDGVDVRNLYNEECEFSEDLDDACGDNGFCLPLGSTGKIIEYVGDDVNPRYSCECAEGVGDNPGECSGIKYIDDRTCTCDDSDGCPDKIGTKQRHKYRFYEDTFSDVCRSQKISSEFIDCWLDTDEPVHFFDNMALILSVLILIGYFVYTGRRRKL